MILQRITLPCGEPQGSVLSAPYKVHLSPLPPSDMRMYHGVQVTSPARSISDAAASGTDLAQVHKAVQDALRRGLVDRDTLCSAANRYPNQYVRNVRQLIEEVVLGAVAEAR
jgi:hypothetical protein